MYGRGQPPLAFYEAAATHSLFGHTRLYHRVAIATSPDHSNPVVERLLQRMDDAHNHSAAHGLASAALRMPVMLASSESFEADLSHLLCARNLVLGSRHRGAWCPGPP